MPKTNKEIGNQGEREVVELVKCPNCSSQFILLPEAFPMFDIQCSRCLFRAQVKTVRSKPKATIFGAGYTIYEKVLKAGYLSPPLIVNFKWESKKDGFNQEIRFYPFIAKSNIHKYQLSSTARRANYLMFKYVKLDKTPFIVLYAQHDPLKTVGK